MLLDNLDIVPSTSQSNFGGRSSHKHNQDTSQLFLSCGSLHFRKCSIYLPKTWPQCVFYN